MKRDDTMRDEAEEMADELVLKEVHAQYEECVQAKDMHRIGDDCLVHALIEACYRVVTAEDTVCRQDESISEKSSIIRSHRTVMAKQSDTDKEVTEWKGQCADLEETCRNHVATIHAVSIECEEKGGRIEELLTEADAREDPSDLAQWQADAEASSKENGKLRRKINNLEQLLDTANIGWDNTIKKLHELRSEHTLAREAMDKAEENHESRKEGYLGQIEQLEKSLESAEAVITGGGAVLAAYTPTLPF